MLRRRAAMACPQGTPWRASTRSANVTCRPGATTVTVASTAGRSVPGGVSRRSNPNTQERGAAREPPDASHAGWLGMTGCWASPRFPVGFTRAVCQRASHGRRQKCGYLAVQSVSLKCRTHTHPPTIVAHTPAPSDRTDWRARRTMFMSRATSCLDSDLGRIARPTPRQRQSTAH
jgi:hypothetical protein